MSEAKTHRWLPQFCSLPTLFAVMVVAEIVALVVVFAPDVHARAWLPRLGVASVYVEWLALLNAVVLCSMRQPLERLPVRSGFVVAWFLCVVVTALGAAVVCRMDQALELGRERVEAASKAQVDALQARIRPHFLFNSMNTIASLIRTRPAEAEQTVEDLSDLFRAALGASDKPGTLGEELDLLGDYLRIEKLRLGDRLGVEIDTRELPRDMPLPRLLLQPLVENAIYHGIQPRADGGTVRIAGRHSKGL